MTESSVSVPRVGTSENFLRKVYSGIAFERLVRGEWRIRTNLPSQTDLAANEGNYGLEIILRNNSFIRTNKSSSTDLGRSGSHHCR